jgi:type VI secretion system protein VasJ
MAYVLGDELQRCLDPFPGAQPFGEDVKYDPVYLELRAEVQKLTALSSSEGAIDWKAIRRQALAILSSRSKDLTVASYLTLALFHLDGYGGLADGLAILAKFCGDGWDGIYPPAGRPRNRVSALEWLVTRLAPFLDERPPLASEAGLLAPLKEQVGALQEVVKSRLLHEAPSFGDLLRALSAHLEKLQPQDEAGARAATAAAAEGGAGAGTGAPGATAAPATAGGGAAPYGGAGGAAVPAAAAAAPPLPAAAALAADATAGEVVERMLVLIPALRQAQPFSVLPYRLLRALRWDTLTGPPPADPATGVTRVPPPRPQQRTALDGLFQAERWADLLHASEGAFQEGAGAFWLDLQRYTVTALERLDAEGGARTAARLGHEVEQLLARFPNLPMLSFADRAPFATEATRQWLAGLAGGAGGEGLPALPGRAGAVADEESTLSAAEAAAIQELLGRQQLGAAFERLQAAVERAAGPRSRFRTRLAASRLCLQAGQGAWARALLEVLEKEAEELTFADWEPETAVDLYQALIICYSRPAKRGGPPDPDAVRPLVDALRKKLLRLDLRAAAELDDTLRR